MNCSDQPGASARRINLSSNFTPHALAAPRLRIFHVIRSKIAADKRQWEQLELQQQAIAKWYGVRPQLEGLAEREAADSCSTFRRGAPLPERRLDRRPHV